MKRRLKRIAAALLGWLLLGLDEGPKQRPQFMVLGLVFGGIVGLGGGVKTIYDYSWVPIELAAVGYCFYCIPRFGVTADEQQCARLSVAGAWLYFVSGIVASNVLFVEVVRGSVLGWPLAAAVSASIVINVVILNFGVQRWNFYPGAQKDIGKLLVRTPILLTLATIGALLGNQDLMKLAVTGVTILFIPATIELLLILAKTPRAKV